MKIKASSKKFLENLQPILGIVPQRTPYNVLKNHLKIIVKEKKFKAITTDIDNIGITEFPIEVEKEGETVIPVKKLVDFLRKIPESDVDIELKGNKINFNYQQGNFSLPVLPSDEYPEIPEMVTKFEFEISGNLLQRMVDKTAFAINTIGSSSVLTNGILWKIKDKKSEMVGASNHRLALYRAEVDNDADFEVVIPQKILIHISSILSDEKVKIKIGEDRISFEINKGEYTFTSRLINFDFPDYSKIVFDKSKLKFSVDRKLLSDVVSRISIFSDNVSYRTVLNFDNKNNLEVTSSSQDSGEAKEMIQFNRISKGKEEYILPINYHYLLDAMKAVDTDSIVFLLNDVDRAVEVVPDSTDSGEELIYVLMPLLT